VARFLIAKIYFTMHRAFTPILGLFREMRLCVLATLAPHYGTAAIVHHGIDWCPQVGVVWDGNSNVCAAAGISCLEL